MGSVKILVLGDVVGQPGRRALFVGLQSLVKQTRAELVVANGENATEGLGLTPENMEDLFRAGVDVITSGNHIWQHRTILPFLDREERLLRPENYPLGVPGKGQYLVVRKEITIAVLNLEGRVHLSHLRCPFLVGKEMVRSLRRKTRIIVVDFHAESSAEKEALGLHLDGKISALVGTHTHVQTADERILPGGTGYITDIGMTGPTGSVIGMKPEISINRSLKQIPYKMEVADTTPVIMGVLLEIDAEKGNTLAIERIRKDFPVLKS